jgi:hypothetical protein
MTILLILSLAVANCDEGNRNLNDLESLKEKFRQHVTVPLNPDQPWIQVSPEQHDWALWHNGQVKPDGGQN